MPFHSFPRTRWLAALLALGAILYVPVLAETSVEDIYRQATEAMRQGNAARAEELFRQVTQQKPELANAWLDMGLAQVKQGKLKEAIASIQSALKINPSLPGAEMFLGVALYQMHRYSEAIPALQAEIAANPSNPETYLWLGIVQMDAGNAELAAAALDKAHTLAPDSLDILDYRGRAHSLVARESYSEMYKIDPDSWHVHRALGEVFAESGQPQQAVDEFKAALRQQPDNADLYELLGKQYQQLKQFDAAESAFQKELVLHPQSPNAMFYLGAAQVERGDVKEGIALLQKVAGIYADSAPVHFYLGLGLSKEGQNSDAISQMQITVRGSGAPDLKTRAWYELAQLYKRIGRPSDAQNALSEFLKMSSHKQPDSNALQTLSAPH